MNDKLLTHLVDNCLDNTGTPVSREAQGVLFVALAAAGESHTDNGYKSNTGRGRCVRKDGSFDYYKMSQLFHAGEW